MTDGQPGRPRELEDARDVALYLDRVTLETFDRIRASEGGGAWSDSRVTRWLAAEWRRLHPRKGSRRRIRRSNG